ncbi:hypothetical protein [Rhizobium ruizarguesonis]|uniref:hypothetical protein n=1 Tax=Rhizobium ruizarguesonis TaxID=2081791 RepID=UPI00103254BD|nr:hypothetical protein [Rhizobium ruizarguesonis]TBE18863.1 hypothetical protein ELH05_31435 [Rhizobium ruizarguesonis]WSH25279.1 hypothetical protein U8Q07_35095 [Rhizobium ruizarguesonis]WSH37618.1 hypothetical protein U8P70_31465 [Rhizobium ruizarguesonis]
MPKRAVFLRFDLHLAENEEYVEVNLQVPYGMLLIIHELQVFIDDSLLEKAWCVLDGSGTDDGGLLVTLNGQSPRLTSPKLVQYQLNRLETTSGISFALRPSSVYLPSIDNVRLLVFRSPAASLATGSVSVTGSVQPYAAPFDEKQT